MHDPSIFATYVRTIKEPQVQDVIDDHEMKSLTNRLIALKLKLVRFARSILFEK